MCERNSSSLSEYISALILFLLGFKIPGEMCQYVESPCPNVFEYRLDNNNELYGFILVRNIFDNVIKLDVQLSVGNEIGSFRGKIELEGSYQNIAREITSKRPIFYKIYFPVWRNIPPKITQISVNGNLICTGPKISFGIVPIITTVNLQHFIQIDVQQLSYPNVEDTSYQNNFSDRSNEGRPPPRRGNGRGPPSNRGPPPGRPYRGPPPEDSYGEPPPEDSSGSRESPPRGSPHRGRPPPRGTRPTDEGSPEDGNFYITYNTRPIKPRDPPTDMGNNRFKFSPDPPKEDTTNGNKFNFRPEMPTDPSKVYKGNPFFLSSTASPDTSFTIQPPAHKLNNPSPVSRGQTGVVQIAPSFSTLEAICGKPLSTNSLIISGNEVPRGAYPWLCAIFGVTATGLSYICSASLISDRHVITAAHCVKVENKERRPQDLLIILGKLNIQKWVPTDGEKMVEPESIHIHPEYESLNSDADVAVMVLSERMQFTKYIRPLCLWTDSTDLNVVVGQTGTVVGWGKDEHGVLMTAEPKQTILPIVSQEQCLRSSYQFQYITSNRTFCGGYRNGSGPCNGDSGSGLIMQRNGRWMLKGIVSLSISDTHSRTCDLSNYVVFTDASKFVPWLLDFIK